MLEALRKHIRITRVFLAVRFAVTFLICLAYLFVVAYIQYLFVGVMGESTFNYITGGVLSLVVGVVFCYYLGAFILMFVKGWHVAALAYANKIEKANASPLRVGMLAFKKNLASFGAVYTVRTILRSALSGFKDKIWTLSEDTPYASTFKGIADNPVVEHLAGDILHYGFDSAIYYLVRYKPDSLEEVPATVLEAVKRYLYCLPSVLISSVSTFIVLRFVPKLVKVLLVAWVFLTQGFIAGVFITVLMIPVFYILDNALFDPLTMTVFLSAYAARCNEEPDPESVVYKTVNAVLSDCGLGDFVGEDEDEEAEVDGSAELGSVEGEPDIPPSTVVASTIPAEVNAGMVIPEDIGTNRINVADDILLPDVETGEMGLDAQGTSSPPTHVGMEMPNLADISAQIRRHSMESGAVISPGLDFEAEDDDDDLPLDIDAGEDDEDVDFASLISKPAPNLASRFSDLSALLQGADLQFDPMQSEDGGQTTDRAGSILAGDE